MAKRADRSTTVLSLRTAIVLLLASLAGVTGGVLVWLGHQNTAEAVLAGLVTGAGAVTFFDRHVERR